VQKRCLAPVNVTLNLDNKHRSGSRTVTHEGNKQQQDQKQHSNLAEITTRKHTITSHFSIDDIIRDESRLFLYKRTMLLKFDRPFFKECQIGRQTAVLLFPARLAIIIVMHSRQLLTASFLTKRYNGKLPPGEKCRRVS